MTTRTETSPVVLGDAALARPGRWLALVVLAMAQLMVVLDGTIVNIALPSIQHELHFSAPGLEWVITAYALTFGGLLLLGGRSGSTRPGPAWEWAGQVRD